MTSSGVPVWGVLGQQGASTALTDEQLESFGPPRPSNIGLWLWWLRKQHHEQDHTHRSRRCNNSSH